MSLQRTPILLLASVVVSLIFAPAHSLVSAGGDDWKVASGFRWRELSLSKGGRVGFAQVGAAVTGVTFSNLLAPARYLTNTMLLNGSGVALGDADGDGRCDIYFCGLDGPNALYRNLSGWKFQEVAKVAGVECADLDATGATFVDLEGDGDLDLVVNTFQQGTRLFVNDGHGQFAKATNVPELNVGRAGTSLALADIDGDADLDLYIANYRTWTVRDRPDTRLEVSYLGGKPTIVRVDGRSVTDPDLAGRFTVGSNGDFEEHGEADLLCLNNGSGRFNPVSFTDGTFSDENGSSLREPPYDWGLTAMFRDINGDGAPDLYVCNDFNSPDRVWINSGRGRFQAIAKLAFRTTSLFSMGVDFADLNRDGADELFVVDMLSRDHQKRHNQIGNLRAVVPGAERIDGRPQYSRNTLFLNRGDGTYSEVSCYSRVTASEWSWTPLFLDVDLDGYEDILVSTGHELDAMNADVTQRAEELKAQKKLTAKEQLRLRKMFSRLDSPNVAFRNRGDLTFEDVSAAWGFDTQGVSHGMAVADLDNDGDLDVVVNNLNGAAGVYRNEASAPRVSVRLKGLPPNTRGIGARITVRGGAVPVQSQEVICGGRYLSGDDAMRCFAAGSLTNELTIEVRWRSGKRSVVNGVKANRVYEIDEAAAEVERGEREQEKEQGDSRSGNERKSWFEDASHLIRHKHYEEAFNDFGLQPLLPRRLSQLGPGVAWHDVDQDGWEDLVIGSGRGGTLALFRNTGRGSFSAVTEPPINRLAGRDQTAVLGLGATLFVGLANYEDGSTNGGSIGIYDLERKVSGESILGPTVSTGPLAMGDIDNDGDLDLFVGGRVTAGRYPEPATSLLMRNEGGKFVVAQRWSEKSSIGLVSGALFSDLDGNGNAELIVACEWGPVRIYRNNGEIFKDVTQELGLADYLGWWNGVTTGDLDGDGRLDLIASNWGLNTQYRASRLHPLKLYYADWHMDGRMDLVEVYHSESTGTEVPERGLRAVGAALPFVWEKVGTFEAYGKSSVSEIYGERIKEASWVTANTLESMIFLNRGGHFVARVMPMEAQLAPAFGICVGDADGDGKEDVFLSQNFFATAPETPRADAARGLWLWGDGRGGFKAVSGQESGIKVYGEQRGAALCDYDHDGRLDLVVTQNGAETRLYRNVGGTPGLRVRLSGPAGNPNGVGAVLRLKFQDRLGPAREVHAGSGYWSQDGATQILSTPESASHLQITWAGGRTATTQIPQGAKEIQLDYGGQVKLLK